MCETNKAKDICHQHKITEINRGQLPATETLQFLLVQFVGVRVKVLICCHHSSLWSNSVKVAMSADFSGRVQCVFPEPRRISGGHPTHTSAN